jgi:outer membrane receptor protein involved in Fe transport
LKTPLKELTTYFNYNEGFRAPTAVELSCANPDAPCTLPNSMVSDPPLKAVVSHTLEVGARGKFNDALKWNFALYQTSNTNDILFLNSPGSVINGYFQNVGATLRQGLELGLSGLAWDSLNWYMSYGLVDATYQTTATLSNALGSETVTPGSKIPSIPQNTFKVGVEYEVIHNVFLGSDLQHVSSQYARGDDQNLYPQIPNYTVVNLNARYVVTKNIELFATGRNILDNHYASFGQLGQNFFQNNQTTTFMGPGAPATGYAGIRIHWN